MHQHKSISAYGLFAISCFLFFFSKCVHVFSLNRTREEQNLVAYPANGKLFYCTTTEIHPEQELLFYYSRDYSRLIGKNIADGLLPCCQFCISVALDALTSENIV